MHIGQTLYKVWLFLPDTDGEACMHSSKSRHKAKEEYDLYDARFGAGAVRWEEIFE